MRQFSSIHLESKPGNTAKCFGMTENLFRYFFSTANQQCTFWSHLSLEPASCHGWPATFFTNLGHSFSIARIKII